MTDLTPSPTSALCVSIMLAAALCPRSAGQFARCEPSVDSPLGVAFSASGTPDALAVFDDGSGPALYAGGDFQIPLNLTGTLNKTAVLRWEGAGWSSLGLFSGNKSVRALTVYDPGGGEELILGGEYPHGVQRWTGSDWVQLGDIGVNAGGHVNDLVVFDGGGGPLLVACGSFTTMDGIPVNGVAQWDGSTWSALGSGVGLARSLAVFDGGGGAELFVCGGLVLDSSSAKVARWDGLSWTQAAAGVNGPVNALTTLTDGGVQTLFAGGDFTQLAGQSANRIAGWDGASWSALAGGLDAEVHTLGVHDDGGGPALYAGGPFTAAGGQSAGGVARWDGTSWSALAPGAFEEAFSFATFDDGGGPALFLGTELSMWTDEGLSKWDGAALTTLPGGTDDWIEVAEVLDDGSGPALYAGGRFEFIGGVAAAHVARWDGTAWSPLGAGLPTTVHDLEVYDDGSGPALFAASTSLHRWDGVDWIEVASSIGSTFASLAVHDEGLGGGPALFVGGTFGGVNGVAAARIARWDGTTWSEVGGGFDGAPVGVVSDLESFEDVAGPQLVASGNFFSAGGQFATRDVAVWDGRAWTPLNGVALLSAAPFTSLGDVAVFDDGGGPRIYAAGAGSTSSPVHQWTGTAWVDFGASGDHVRGLGVGDDGSGTGFALFAVGPSINGARLAQWDGASWTTPLDRFGVDLDPFTIAPLDSPAAPEGSWMVIGGQVMLDVFGSGCDPPLVYCTPKTSSAGCDAAISTSDLTSQPVSGAADYSVLATGIQGFKNGHVFVGISGPAALPFLGGTLCVMPPTKRGPTMNSQGSGPGSCDGSYSDLVNDGLLVPFGQDPGPGNSAWYQWWYRDPNNGTGPFGTALSDAVQLDFQ